jgi:cytoskeleton protein RodZ
MRSEAGGDEAREIGARLRLAREKKHLTVLQAAEKLHVDARVLEALEGEDFDALGADVYVRGHLRRYAELVGEAPDELQGLYAASRQSERPDLTRIPHREPGRAASQLVMPTLLSLGGFALAALLWWFLTEPGEKAQPLPLIATDAAAGSTAEKLTAAARRVAAAAPEIQAAGAEPPQLGLKFSAISWVEVTDASGRRLLEGLFAPGAVRTLSGAPPLRVVIGNVPAVALEANGQPVVLAPLVHRDGSAHLMIDAAGHASPLAPRLAAHGD